MQAASIDCKMSTIKDGNYFKLAHTQKAVIVGRIQSWMLVDNEKGALPPEVVLPTVDRKLRPGQTKPKEKKRRASGANKAQAPKATTASKSKPTKMAKPSKRALAVIAKKRNDASSDNSEDEPLQRLRNSDYEWDHEDEPLQRLLNADSEPLGEPNVFKR